MKITPFYYAIRMEKLEPAYGDDYAENALYDISELVYNFKTNGNAENYAKDGEDYEEAYSYKMGMLEQNQPGITAACQLIASLSNVYSDFHMGNIMLRGDTIVITDPVSSVES